MWTREKNPLEKLMAKEELLTKLKITPFQRELLKYMHISDCSLANDCWKDSWEFCPVCGGFENREGRVEHRDKVKDAC